MSLDYKKAGVDVGVGDQLVDWLQNQKPNPTPWSKNLIDGIGGFAAIFKAQFPQMKSPCLVSSTDGVGTKVKLASQALKFNTIGQDLVAMCVNDLICCGASPLFFLDYYAVGKLDLAAAQAFLQGVREACHQSECLLIGGETAEMPGIYQPGDFDCAGFSVGVVDEENILGAARVKGGDLVYALPSSGFHSNGYSLLRRVFEHDLSSWLDILLKPTELYVKASKALIQRNIPNAFAHITGGGVENIPRVVPAHLQVHLSRWTWPEPFLEVQRRTGLSEKEMLTTLNCGAGLAVIFPENRLEDLKATTKASGYEVFPIGKIVERKNEDSLLWP